jgi:hypothetical protein
MVATRAYFGTIALPLREIPRNANAALAAFVQVDMLTEPAEKEQLQVVCSHAAESCLACNGAACCVSFNFEDPVRVSDTSGEV